MKLKNKKILMFVSIGIVLIVSMYFVFNKKEEYKELPRVKLKEDNNKKQFALMIEQTKGKGDYEDGSEEYTNTFPTEGYRFNESMSGCIDGNGQDVEGAIEYNYDNYSITVKTNKTIYCYLYYDIEEIKGEVTFYIKESGSNKFTNSLNNNIHITYEDNSINKYCLTEEENSNECVWKDTSNKTIDDNYTFKTDTNEIKTVYAYLKSKSNEIKSTSDTITLDTVNPVLTEANYTVTSTGPTNVTATIGEVTELNPYQYCFRNGNSGNFECGTSKTKEYTATAGTTYTIYAYVMDKAGNVSSTLNKSVTPVKPTAYGTQLEGKEGLTTDPVGGMYRYQGTNDVPNWICFGTKDQNQCKTNYDKYMYRIIGITQTGQMYLLKETFLKEGSVTGFAWNNKYSINSSSSSYCPNGVCPEWNQADLFKRINGTANGTSAGGGTGSTKADTDIFVDSTYYDYLKSGDKVNGGTNESDWYKLIVNHDWMYGDTTETSDSKLYNGNEMYNIETGKAETTHNTGTSGSVTSQNYTWTNTVNAKISLMYLHDIDYAYLNVKNSWIFFQKDGYNSSPSWEWLSTRWGVYSTGSTNVSARAVYTDGGLNHDDYLHGGNGARPVFYLSSEAKITGGDGTQNLPYILSWN